MMNPLLNAFAWELDIVRLQCNQNLNKWALEQCISFIKATQTQLRRIGVMTSQIIGNTSQLRIMEPLQGEATGLPWSPIKHHQ